MQHPAEIAKPTPTPPVTVLIAAYNAERTLRRALDSVLAQTAAASQIIVVDDGSQDRTHQVAAQAYAGRVLALSQKNGGVSSARNRGLQVATGEFVAFLDADDWWAPEKLERQLQVFASRPQTEMTYTGLVVVDEETGAECPRTPTNPRTLWPQLRWTNPFIPPSSVMVRRSVLEELRGFNETLSVGEDWELWFKLARRKSLLTTPEPFTYYQLGPSGLSGDPDRMFRSFLQMLDGPLLDGLTGAARPLWRRRILSYQAYKAGLTARGAGNRSREREYMRQSLLSWPSPFWQPERFKSILVTFLRG